MPFYVEVCGECQYENEGDYGYECKRDCKFVILQFKDKEEWEKVEGMSYDSAYGVLNEMLDKGWYFDDVIETYNFVSEEEAQKRGFIAYRWS